MRLKLIHKLLLALFLTTAVMLVVMALVIRVSLDRGFESYIRQQENTVLLTLADDFAAWYTQHGDWQVMQERPAEFASIISSSGVYERLRDVRGPGQNRPRRGFSASEGRLGPGPGPRLRIALYDREKHPVIGPPLRDIDAQSLVPVESGGETVGWLGRGSGGPGPFRTEEQDFLKSQGRVLLIGLSGGLVVAALMAWLLSRQLSRPVSRVASGIRSLAAGQYDTRVEAHGGDEIDDLGRDVNRLATTLSQNEEARQRWMADVAHELRTPISIMSGELEAMKDGIRQLDSESVESLCAEVTRLSRLVDDLRNLALSDSGALSYRMDSVNFGQLVNASVISMESRASAAGLTLEFEPVTSPIMVRGDERRLHQLLVNLLENAIRYTEAPGKVGIGLSLEQGYVRLGIDDTPPGVPPEDCERIFERLHRQEDSRNRGTGGSGLGLAICRNIVHAHEGDIEALPSELGGLQVCVTLSVLE